MLSSSLGHPLLLGHRVHSGLISNFHLNRFWCVGSLPDLALSIIILVAPSTPEPQKAFVLLFLAASGPSRILTQGPTLAFSATFSCLASLTAAATDCLSSSFVPVPVLSI